MIFLNTIQVHCRSFSSMSDRWLIRLCIHLWISIFTGWLVGHCVSHLWFVYGLSKCTCLYVQYMLRVTWSTDMYRESCLSQQRQLESGWGEKGHIVAVGVWHTWSLQSADVMVEMRSFMLHPTLKVFLGFCCQSSNVSQNHYIIS